MADESWDDIVTEAETSGFGEPAPVGGPYEVRIFNAEAAEIEVKGEKKPVVKMKFKITSGEHAGKPATTYGHTVWKSPAWAIVANCAAVGITGEALKKHQPTMAQIAAAMEGKTVSITTEPDAHWKTGEIKTDRANNPVIRVKGMMQKSKTTPAQVVTHFPPVGGATGNAWSTPTTPTVPTAPAPF
jgi:hypothetical protein